MSLSLIAFVLLNVLAASSGAIFKPDSWYDDLKKPSWQPPKWAFPIVWSILYLFNIVAGWLVYQAEGAITLPLVIYGIGLILNALWSAIFFGMKRMDWGTFEAAFLWLFVALQMVLFLPIAPIAALLTAPYLVWVSVAFFLSLTVWRLNPDA